jgi:predicted ATPase/DNA-binding SARP family transcriptional activator
VADDEVIVQVRLLGAFEVVVDGRPVPSHSWHRRSAASLVKLLALEPGARLHRERVIDTLWPDLTLEEASPRLHKAAHYARTALGRRDSILVENGSLWLCPAATLTVDVVEFERAATIAQTDGSAAAAAEALSRYGGDLLPGDLYEPWTDEPRSRMRLRWLGLLRTAGRLEELVAADPLDEEAHLALVRDHVEHGRRREALAALDRHVKVLAEELGVEPGPAAQSLRRAALALPQGPPATPRRTSLPSARTRLIGRASDLEAVSGLLETHRVVTITGPGGAGKSTLALAVARNVQATNSDPRPDVVLAELAPVRTAPGVTRAVAEAVGVQGPGAVRTASLAAVLGSRPLLLVLDNCEHLLDASAELVDALLDAGEAVRVLVTSREPLRIDGEVEHRLGSLGAESAELFVERASAVAGPGVVTATDPRVVELCARLDGLPLAIELAAAQLRHLALPELVARLDDRLALLVGGRPKAGERHSALTATIEWSYRLLGDESRAVFDRLGVFPADFDLEAVQAVAAPHSPVAVTSLLGDLVAKSLVVHDAATARYRLLETIRLFAAQRLEESGLRSQTLESLRGHMVSRARSEPRVCAWLSTTLAARSRDDLDNVRLAFETSLRQGDSTSALDLAISLGTLWRNAVSYAEGQRWVTSLRERELEPRDRLWTLILAADVHLGSGDGRGVREVAEQAVLLPAGVADEGAAVIADIYEAVSHLVSPAQAVERLEAAVRRAGAAGEPGLLRIARGYRMVALLMLGSHDGLREEARFLTEQASGRDYARYLCTWAASLVALVDRDGAWQRQLMDQQHEDLAATGLRENWLTMYWESLALVAEGADYLPQLRRARATAVTEGRTAADADCVLALAYAAACRDDWERAAQLLGVIHGALLPDTAGYIHQEVLREQLVKPRMAPEAFAELETVGRGLVIDWVLREAGL